MEDDVARVFKEFIAIDKDLESMKQILSLRSDFNLEDAFKVFDLDGKGQINLREFEEGLNYFQIYPRREELQILIQKYDLD